MRPIFPLLAASLAACSQPADVTLAAPEATTEVEARPVSAVLEAAHAAPAREALAAEVFEAAEEQAVTSFLSPPPDLGKFLALPPAPAVPFGLLSDPEADEDDFEEWYAGASDFHVFTLREKLQQHQNAREVHPNELTPELDFLKAEVNRRWARRTSTLAANRPSDYARVYRRRGLDELAFRQWELQHELSLHQQERWKLSGRPILL